MNLRKFTERECLDLLKLTRDHFGRFSCAYRDGREIIVQARIGGENAEDYPEVFEQISNHPWYSYEIQNESDGTYVNFYFDIPQNVEID